jgi:hypothetical protein
MHTLDTLARKHDYQLFDIVEMYNGAGPAIVVRYDGYRTEGLSDRLYDIAERKGFLFYHEDEVVSDEEGNTHVSEPDGWGFIPTFHVIECTVWGKNEVIDDPEPYADEIINNSDFACLWSEVDFSSLGFTKTDEHFENGWHDGQTDEPSKILEALQARGYDVIFSIDGVGQFDVSFSTWIREEA